MTLEELAETLADGLPLVPPKRERRVDRERCIRFKLPQREGWRAELVVRREFVRLNLAERPTAEVLGLAGLREKPTDDRRWAFAAEVRPQDARGARLLLETACGGGG